MQLELIQTSDNKYKIISKSSKKHPALQHLANLLEEANKYEDVKIGIYNIYGGQFSTYKSIYSYISGKVEKMGKTKFYKFLKGKAQMKPISKKNDWKPIDINAENETIDLELID